MNQSLLFLMMALILAVTALALYVLGLLAGYLRENCRSIALNQALLLLDRVVADTVKELNQTVVADLKGKSPDGRLAAEEADRIRNKAVELVLTRLKSSTLGIIQESLGPIMSVLISRIESTVWECGTTSPPRPAGSCQDLACG